MNKRNEIIDILKGIAICLIVLGHTKFFGIKYLYLFHVAVFVIASGFFYKYEKVKTIKDLFQYVLKKIKTLYIPYIIVNLFFLFFNNIFIKIGIYSVKIHYFFSIKDYIKNSIKVLCFRGVTELAGATWFLQLLFIICILFTIITYILNKLFKCNYNRFLIGQFIISTIFLVTGYFISRINYPSFISIIVIVLNCYWLFLFGLVFNKIKEWFCLNKKSIVFIAGLIVSLFILGNIGKIEISKNIYTSLFFYIICSILGWLLLYYFSMIINKCYFKKIMIYLGRSTLFILLFHFLGFKIVNLIIYLFVDKNKNILSSFPTSKGGLFVILYFILGILASIIINQLFIAIKKLIAERRIHHEIRSSNSNL